MLLQFERDPTFRNDDLYDLTKDQQRQRVMTRVSIILNLLFLKFNLYLIIVNAADTVEKHD